MEWRCEWCGKPHEEDDPPCDNCGHGTFEKAVVQQTDLSVDGPETTLVWVCTDCGREHTKHSPPCSRCGSPSLEKREQGVADDELTAPGYLDLLTPRYLAVLGLVVVLAAVLALGFAGIVDLPGMGHSDVPEVKNVPGNETTASNGVSLAAVGDSFVDGLNDQRSEAGVGTLERDSRLDEIARFQNQQRVRADVEGASVDEETAEELILEQCDVAVAHGMTTAVDEETDVAAITEQFFDPQGALEQWETVGVHVHAVDDEVYLYRILCG